MYSSFTKLKSRPNFFDKDLDLDGAAKLTGINDASATASSASSDQLWLHLVHFSIDHIRKARLPHAKVLY